MFAAETSLCKYLLAHSLALFSVKNSSCSFIEMFCVVGVNGVAYLQSHQTINIFQTMLDISANLAEYRQPMAVISLDTHFSDIPLSSLQM